uniref:Uncharacterized protein n=1 Tax=Chenopodium quinoa TaxID=63459 RepID=A0A803L0N3_CHEQI
MASLRVLYLSYVNLRELHFTSPSIEKLVLILSSCTDFVGKPYSLDCPNLKIPHIDIGVFHWGYKAYMKGYDDIVDMSSKDLTECKGCLCFRITVMVWSWESGPPVVVQSLAAADNGLVYYGLLCRFGPDHYQYHNLSLLTICMWLWNVVCTHFADLH